MMVLTYSLLLFNVYLWIFRIWEEDEDSDGNGTECYVRIYSNQSIEDYLKSVGTVPIPPYLHRSSEDNDKDSYNNVYAHHAGSVAAPTAGMSFFVLYRLS